MQLKELVCILEVFLGAMLYCFLCFVTYCFLLFLTASFRAMVQPFGIYLRNDCGRVYYAVFSLTSLSCFITDVLFTITIKEVKFCNMGVPLSCVIIVNTKVLVFTRPLKYNYAV